MDHFNTIINSKAIASNVIAIIETITLHFYNVKPLLGTATNFFILKCAPAWVIKRMGKPVSDSNFLYL